MRISVSDAARQLEERGLLQRLRHDQSDKIIERVSELLGREVPSELADFYRENIASIGAFQAIAPVWNDWVGWHRTDSVVTELSHVDAIPLFGDGCGNLFGVDVTPGVRAPAVYFFDHETEYEEPEYAAGSSIGAFLLLLADHDQAFEEDWPLGWEAKIDPDIDKCPRAPAIWNEGAPGLIAVERPKAPGESKLGTQPPATRISVSDAVRRIEKQWWFQRANRDYSDKIIKRVGELLGRQLPSELVELYRENIIGVRHFAATAPIWDPWIGWQASDDLVTRLLHANAVPLFWDNHGNFFGLDLTPGVERPAVYFFHQRDGFAEAQSAAGSSIGAFLLVLANSRRSILDDWQLTIDPDIDKCPRASAIWRPD